MGQTVIAAFPKEESNRKFKNILTQSGYHVPCMTQSGNHVLNRAVELRYGIVLTGLRLPDMTWKDLADRLPRGFSLVLLLSSRQKEAVEDALSAARQGCRVFCLELPFTVSAMVQVLRQADAYAQGIHLQDRQQPRKRTAREEALIRQAKALLMEKRQMTEMAAHRYLQRRSMESQTSLVESAQKIIAMYS